MWARAPSVLVPAVQTQNPLRQEQQAGARAENQTCRCEEPGWSESREQQIVSGLKKRNGQKSLVGIIWMGNEGHNQGGEGGWRICVQSRSAATTDDNRFALSRNQGTFFGSSAASLPEDEGDRLAGSWRQQVLVWVGAVRERLGCP